MDSGKLNWVLKGLGAPRGTVHTPEHNAKLGKAFSKWRLENPQGEAERNKKLSKIMKEMPRDEVWRKHCSEAQTRRWARGDEILEYSLRTTEQMLRQWKDPKIRERNIKGLRGFWDNVDPKWKKDFLARSRNSPESSLVRVKACKRPPSENKDLVRGLLEKEFPGRFIYNGDGSQNVLVGVRIPDFVEPAGGKKVLSVMGGIGFIHFLEDEEIEIEYYKKYGYGCLVLWDYDIWSVEGVIERIRKFCSMESHIEVGDGMNEAFR